MNQDIDLRTVNAVKDCLTDEPLRAEVIAVHLGVTAEQAYQSLVQLYDGRLALIERKRRTGEVAGWVAA